MWGERVRKDWALIVVGEKLCNAYSVMHWRWQIATGPLPASHFRKISDWVAFFHRRPLYKNLPAGFWPTLLSLCGSDAKGTRDV